MLAGASSTEVHDMQTHSSAAAAPVSAFTSSKAAPMLAGCAAAGCAIAGAAMQQHKSTSRQDSHPPATTEQQSSNMAIAVCPNKARRFGYLDHACTLQLQTCMPSQVCACAPSPQIKLAVYWRNLAICFDAGKRVGLINATRFTVSWHTKATCFHIGKFQRQRCRSNNHQVSPAELFTVTSGSS